MHSSKAGIRDVSAYYKESWALVIGIDNYRGRYEPLKNAKNDAKAFADLLEKKHGFHVTTLLDEQATRDKIMEMLRDEFPAKVGRNDRVVLFFAGHGTTWSIAAGTESTNYGYLIPQDAIGTPNRPKYSEFIDMFELQRICSIIPAKHIFIVLDCCFAGVAAVAPKKRGEFQIPQEMQYDAYIQRATEYPAWQILTAGLHDERVADSGLRSGHSAFTNALLDGLEGEADHNADGLITVSELGDYVSPRVSRETSIGGFKGQTPFCGWINGSDQGNFIFISGGLKKAIVKHIDVNPYSGLNAFTEKNAQFFYGREKVLEELLERLSSSPRFIGARGRSGGGKSSLLQAGLIPRMHKGSFPGSDRWDIILIRPGERPFERLEEAGLKDISSGLVEATRSWHRDHPGSERLFLILDQFDEFLTVCPKKTRDEFLESLSELLERLELPVTVLLSIRDDFLDRLSDAAPFLKRWVETEFINLASDLNEEEIRAIIERPAAQVGLKFEKGLIDTIIDDVMQASPGVNDGEARSSILPLLESSLTKLCDACRDRCIATHKDYVDIGKLSGELPSWAEKAYERLSIDGLGTSVRSVLIELVSLGDDKQGIPDSRRRRPLQAIAPEEGQREAAHRVVQRLADARLVTTSFDRRNKQICIEIIHDALIRDWKRLQQWLDEGERSFLAWKREMEKRAQAWEDSSDQEAKRDEGRLLRGSDLSDAQSWLQMRAGDIGQKGQKYIAASLRFMESERELKEQERAERERSERRKKRQMYLVSFLLLLLLIAILLVGLALNEKTEEVMARSLASQSEQNDDISQAVLLAVESLWHKETPEGISALRRSLDFLPRSLEHNSSINCMAFSPEGSRLATGSEDNMTRLWDVETGKQRWQLKDDSPVNALAFSPDGRMLATGSENNTIRLWNVETGKQRWQLKDDSPVNTLAFSPDGSRLATGCYNNTASLWNVENGSKLHLLNHGGAVNAVAFSPDGSTLATGCEDNYARLWYVQNGTVRWERKHDYTISALNFSPDGEMLAVASDKWVHLWSAKTGRKIWKQKNDGLVNDLAFSRDGQYLATGSENNTKREWEESVAGYAYIWIATSGEKFHELLHVGGVRALAFSPDGSMLATGSEDNTARLWDVKTGIELREWKHNGSVNAVAFSPDGSRLATRSEDKSARLWDVKTGDEIELHDAGLVQAMAFGKRRLATSSDEATIVWEAKKGYELIRLEHGKSMDMLTFSHNESKLAASSDKTVHLWDVYTGEELQRMEHESSVYAMAFNQNESMLATGCKDGTVRIWMLDVSATIDEACSRIAENMTQEEWKNYMNTPSSDCITCPARGEFNRPLLKAYKYYKENCRPCHAS